MRRFLDTYTAPKKEIPRHVYLSVSVLVGVSIFAFWSLLSYSGWVREDFLPKPIEVVQAAITGWDDGSLSVNTGVSLFEIMAGFILASIFAVSSVADFAQQTYCRIKEAEDQSEGA